MTQIVVVGAGIGGCIAALRAKDIDSSADVTLVSTAPERYRYEPGTVDVLGYTETHDGPLERPLFGIGHLPEDHPYNLLGDEVIRNALGFFDEQLVDDDVLPYKSGRTKNALAPTLSGNVRPTSRYPAGLASGLVSSQRPMHLVGFEQITHIDVELVANTLDAATPYDVTWSTTAFPLDPSEYPPLESFATALDENRSTPEGTPVREAVADQVRPELDIEPRVGFPAMLGLDRHEKVRTELASMLHAEVFEIPVGEPSLPGRRLRSRLFELVDEAGVELVDATAVTAETAGDSLSALQIDETERESQKTLAGDSFVLATGGVAAGGIVATQSGVHEPVFDCPVSHPDNRQDWSEPAPLGDHQFTRFGVEVTPALQPTADGEIYYENLYAAGTVIGGHNFVNEHSRGGVAVTTGYEAGRRALEDV